MINVCYGGFGLSPQALLWLFERGFDTPKFKYPVEKYFRISLERKSESLERWREYLHGKHEREDKKASLFLDVYTPDEQFILNGREIPRDHPLLVECVETLKEKSFGSCAELRVVEIPDGIKWEINEYDGNESVEEEHRSWR